MTLPYLGKILYASLYTGQLPMDVIQLQKELQFAQEEQLKAEEMADKLIKLQRIIAALSQASTRQQIADIIVSIGAAAVGADSSSFWFVNADNNLEYSSTAGLNSKQIELSKEVLKESLAPARIALQTQKPLYVSNISDIENELPRLIKVVRIFNRNSFAVYPIVINGKNIGLVSFGYIKEKVFTPEDKEYMATIISQTKEALERIDLTDSQAQLIAAQKASYNRLQRLYKISTAFSKVLTSQEICRLIVEEGSAALGSAGGEVALLTDHNTMDIVAHAGYPLEFTKNWKIKDSPITPFIRKAAVHKKPFFMDRSNLRFALKNPISKRFHEVTNYKYCAALPLIVKAKAIGVIEFVFQNQSDFEAPGRSFMIALAEQCSLALERTRLYDRQEEFVKEIARRERRFRSLIENSSDGIFLLDKEIKILYASPSTRQSGFDPKKRIGENGLANVLEEDREKIAKVFKELVLRPKAERSMTYRARDKNGKIHWIRSKAKNMLGDSAVNAFVVNYQDITSQKEAAEEVKRSRDELEIILASSVDAITMWDTLGNIVYSNNAGLRLLRIESLDQLKSPRLLLTLEPWVAIKDEYLHEIPKEDLPTAKAIATGKTQEKTVLFEFKDGSTEWRYNIATPVKDDSGKLQFIVNVSRDVTLEREKEQTKDEFISTASHELKTPITSIKLYLDLITRKLSDEDREVNGPILGKMEQQVGRLTKLINDLLDTTRIRSGKLIFHREKVGFDEFVKNVVEEMQYTTPRHKLVIKGHTGKKLLIDKSRKHQVLVNLISNAIKYSPKGNKIIVSLSKDKNFVKVCIRDFGIGVGKENKEKIFEPFYRSHYVEGERYPGLGLGLHISAEIVKRSGGSIWVENTKGKGSLFCFTIPIKPKNE